MEKLEQIKESVDWIMVTLYGHTLTVEQYNELLEDVTALVVKWENILERSEY